MFDGRCNAKRFSATNAIANQNEIRAVPWKRK
jgi:hypothetical protein